MLDRSHPGHHDWNGSRNGSGPNSPDLMYDPRLPGHPVHHHLAHGHPLFHPALQHLRPPVGTPPDSNHNTTPNTNNKPRIWSLADMASKENSSSKERDDNSSLYAQNSSPGKIISPLARGLSYHPYLTRPDAYRSLYPSPHEIAALEQYQRHFLAANGISSSMMGKGPFTPLSLTTAAPNLSSSSNNNNNNSPHHPSLRASSPASSTSSTDREISVSDKPTALVTTHKP